MDNLYGINDAIKVMLFDVINYQGDTFQNDPEDPLTSIMILLAHETTHRYSIPTNNRLQSSSNTRNQAAVQADKVNIQSRNEMLQTFSATIAVQKVTMLGIIQSKEFRILKTEELSADICMMAKIQPTSIDSDEGPSYDSAFISEVQTPSTSYINLLFSGSNHEQTYHEQPKINKSITSDDQINSNIIFDDPNVKVNNGSVEHDKIAHDLHDNELEQLARNAYKEAEKQQILSQKVKQQKVKLPKQLDQYKERVRVSDDELEAPMEAP
ncbi:hypothetical protein Tco_0363421 [Tanacetum coccineum]